jgi:hypothetical protein
MLAPAEKAEEACHADRARVSQLPGGATQVHLTVQVDPSGKVTLVLSAEGTDNARRWDGFAVRAA